MSIRKRTWTAAGETKSAWVVVYRDQHGKRRLKTFNLKKDAEAWATTALHEVAQGAHASDTKTSVADIVDAWISHGIDEGLERGTIEPRKRHLKLHIAPFIGPVKLADLTTPRVNGFMDQLRDGGRSQAMRRKILTSLSSAVTFAKGRGLVAQNACQGVKVRSDGRGKTKVVIPTKSELKLLIDRAPERWRPFIVTAIFTGMRVSELRGLRWADVDLDAGIIHVTQRADAWGTIGSPKSAAGTRDIPLTPLVVNTLRQWKLQNSGELVFPNSHGRPFKYANFHTFVWKPLLKACNSNYEFHSLRHAAASLFIELGWQPK
ncbi:MAG TPA: site-specific integrase, partial [Xanthobacteraceae bacterium]|nr:site-specific integrase [Xanthobacteraceae bacterium]